MCTGLVGPCRPGAGRLCRWGDFGGRTAAARARLRPGASSRKPHMAAKSRGAQARSADIRTLSWAASLPYDVQATAARAPDLVGS